MLSKQLAAAFVDGPSEDSAVADRLARSIQGRTGGRVRGLRVEVSGTDVALYGQASTYYVKQLATHAVFDELTGAVVDNSIDVN